jgi:hypothetical protein
LQKEFKGDEKEWRRKEEKEKKMMLVKYSST